MALHRTTDARAEPIITTETLVDLMTRFESLGRDCEFGLVQRICGAEPLGLFRFAGSKIDNLCRALENRLDDFLTDDDLAVEIRDSEYMTYSRSYRDFHAHTLAYTDRDDEADVRARELKKVTYLRRRFLADWSGNQRIYVYCGDEDQTSIVRLLTILQRDAPCNLLWVVAADDAHRRGEVERLRPRLFKAYLAHLLTYHDGPRMDLPGWAQICFVVDAHVRGTSTPVAPPFFRRIPADMTWSRSPNGLIESGPTLVRCRVLRERADHVPVARVTLRAPFVRQDRLVFSAWVSLSKTFESRLVTLRGGDRGVVSFGNADFTLREKWQQVWVVMKAAAPTSSIDVHVCVEAVAGSQFFIAGAQVEDGPVPSEALKPAADPVWPEIEPGDTRRPSRLAKRFGRTVRLPEPVAEADRMARMLLLQGDALMRERCFDEADIVLSAGLVLWPWKAEFYSHRGLCAEMSGDPDRAAEHWRALIRFFPEVAMGYHRLAAALRAIGRTGEAVTIVEGALADHGNDPAMVAEAARVFEAAARPRDALALWDRVIADHGTCQDWLDARDHVLEAIGPAAAAS